MQLLTCEHKANIYISVLTSITMVYIEKRLVGKKEYYYIVKNVRLKGGKWEKIRKYAGDRKPSEDEVKKFAESIESDKKTKARYLTKGQISLLRKIRIGYKDYLGKLTEHDFLQFEDATITSFTYNTNAIEGSTLSLQETGLVLTKSITPEGKALREVYGAVNMKEAYDFMRKMRGLNEQNIKKLHFIVMKNILTQELGEYRTVPVRIIGSMVQPPFPIDVSEQMKDIILWYNKNRNLHPFELACLLHIRFEKIHPFRDGNGRVGRLIMNFVLLKAGFPLLDIKAAKKLLYYKTLEAAQIARKHKGFIDYSISAYLEDAKSMGWV